MSWLVARIIRSFLFRARRSLAHSRLASQRYQLWIKRYDTITPELREQMAADIATWPSHPLISVIMPSYNVDPKWMRLAINRSSADLSALGIVHLGRRVDARRSDRCLSAMRPRIRASL